jgi:5-methylcytosine-specific restriction endonuclease McrA
MKLKPKIKRKYKENYIPIFNKEYTAQKKEERREISGKKCRAVWLGRKGKRCRRKKNYVATDKFEYIKYLHSNHWQRFRKFMIGHVGKCQNCGSKERLQVHHLVYKERGKSVLYHEKYYHVMVLCRDCHRNVHHIIKEEDEREGPSDLPESPNEPA